MVTEFKINETDTIVGKTHNSRTGFRHVVEYRRNGRVLESRSVNYYNRTWESYQYESAISALLTKMKFSESEKAHIMDITAGRAKADLDARFGSTAMVAKMGDLFENTPEKRVAWKLRMIKAGAGEGLQLPDDWDSLSVAEQEKRLDAIIQFMEKGR